MDYKIFCENLARQAGALMKANFALGMKKEWKGDASPVTTTDLTINQMVIDAVRENFPGHSVLAEEGSMMIEGSEYTWVCDPVDGTRPFSHGVPVFVFALALTHHGQVECGIIYDPMMDRLWWAQKGKGAFLNEYKISVSSARAFEKTVVVLDMPDKLPYYFPTLRYALRLKKAGSLTLGSVLYSGALVACGEFAAVMFTGTSAHDAAALKIIIEEAGGKMTDIFGHDQQYDQPTQGFLASNGYLHEEFLALVKANIQPRP